MRSGRWFLVAGGLMVAGQAINLLLKGLFNAPVSTVIYVAIVVLFATWHGVLRYGFARILGFGVAVTVISWSFETWSILTGFPFGSYQYTDRIGPKIGLVPVVVPPVYFAMGYVSWTVAQALLSVRGAVLSGVRLIVVPLAAAFVMVVWHLPIDPVNATVGGYWVWRDGGPFFGVPLLNFFGWFLCVWTFFMVFAAMNRLPPAVGVPAIVERRWYWLLPVLMYASFVLDHAGAVIGRGDRAVTTGDGHVWWTGDIHSSMLLIALFTAIPIALNAAWRIIRDLPSSASGEGPARP